MPALSRAKWPILALFAGLCVAAAWVWPFSVDDAYITARYARRIAQGFGYTFNEGDPTDGVTGPLWLVPLVLAARLGLDPIAASKVVGLSCSLVACTLCVLRARRRAHGALLAWATASVCVSSTALSVWSVAGLETAAATLACTTMALHTTAPGRPRGLGLGLSIAALAWLRPEMAVAATVALVCAFLRDRKEALVALGLAAFGACSLLSFRLLTFGDLLPLSVHAKPAELGHGVGYVFSALRSIDALLLLALLFVGVRAGARDERMHGAMLAGHVLACVLAGGDWMPGLRLLAPLVPIAALGTGAGIRALYAKRRRWASAVWTVTLLFSFLTMWRELPAVRAAGENRSVQVTRMLAAMGARPSSVAALDIGALGYFSGARIVDLGGLVEPVLAHARGGHMDKKIDQDWFARQQPSFIVLHSATEPRIAEDGQLLTLAGYPVEQRVARMPLVRATYRTIHVQRYGSRYFYVILARTSSSADPQ